MRASFLRKTRFANKVKINRNRRELHGVTKEGYEPIRHLFEKNFQKGIEEKAQVCVYVGEEMVVNLWGESPMKDVARTERRTISYNEDTFASIQSCTKVLTAICMATLVERGLLDYTDTVQKHWPEFVNGQPEKESITIEHILRHEAGMNKLSQTLSMAALLRENIKNNSIGRVIEEQTLRFPPEGSGTRTQYHIYSFGFILNEIFRRVDPNRRTIGEYLREEISNPLNAGAHIGLTYDELANSSPLCALTPKQVFLGNFRPTFMGRKVQCSFKEVIGSIANIFKMTKQGKSVSQLESLIVPNFYASFSGVDNSIINMGEAPGFGGQANAKGLAKIAAMMANGGTMDGIRFLSESTWKALHHGAVMKPMYPLGGTSNFTQGGVNIFDTVKNKTEWFKNNELRKGFVGWMGLGGSVMQWHPEHKIGFGYIPTFWSAEDSANTKGALLQKAVVECTENILQ